MCGNGVAASTEDYPYHADSGRENLTGIAQRVLRGGSFDDRGVLMARCAVRYVDEP